MKPAFGNRGIDRAIGKGGEFQHARPTALGNQPGGDRTALRPGFRVGQRQPDLAAALGQKWYVRRLLGGVRELVDHQLGLAGRRAHCASRRRLSSAAISSLVKALGWPSWGMLSREAGNERVKALTATSGMPSLRTRSRISTSQGWANSEVPKPGWDVSSGHE